MRVLGVGIWVLGKCAAPNTQTLIPNTQIPTSKIQQQWKQYLKMKRGAGYLPLYYI